MTSEPETLPECPKCGESGIRDKRTQDGRIRFACSHCQEVWTLPENWRELNRTEPPDTLPWVDQFMRDVQRDYLFYNKVDNVFAPIVFSEETTTNDEGEENHCQEVCFRTDDGTQPINDEYVYYKHKDAMSKLITLDKKLKRRVNLFIFAFRHPEDDYSSARTIEETVLVNKLGWGIFRRRDLPEAPNTEGEGE